MLQFFVVFHDRIYDQSYEDIDQRLLDKYFTFIAVNPSIPKHYTPNKYKVINEWELPNYNADMQKYGYKENSAIYHVWMNKLHEPYSYVGFFQYDMKFSKDTIPKILDIIHRSSEPIYFSFEPNSFQFIFETWGREINTATRIILDYNVFFNKTFTFTKEYPLWNTFVLPVDFYANKMMPWISQLYKKLWPWCVQPPNQTHWGHIAGIYERVSAMVIGEENMKQISLPSVFHHHHETGAFRVADC